MSAASRLRVRLQQHRHRSGGWRSCQRSFAAHGADEHLASPFDDIGAAEKTIWTLGRVVAAISRLRHLGDRFRLARKQRLIDIQIIRKQHAAVGWNFIAHLENDRIADDDIVKWK